MVATSQPLAVAAGLEILSLGGNAADAAVASAAALNVTEPTSTGIGGDVFALFYNAQTGQVSALNASGRAPQALTLERLKADVGDELPPLHPHTVTVPGACAGWVDAVEQWGTIPLAAVLAPAIRLAEEGFPVAPITAHAWSRGAARQLSTAANGLELTLNGRAPRAGEIFRNPGLARTFRTVAEGGKAAFYQGPIAQAIVDVLNASGSVMALEDLAAHTSSREDPIFADYRGYRIWECPPNGQGLAALLALNILEGFDLAEMGPLSTERLHLMIEAMRLAFADANWFVADPAVNPAPLEELLSQAYTTARRKLIKLDQAVVDQVHGSPVAGSDTVYLSVVDGDGNACSFINSNYMGFGTGIVPKGWGFTLQNRGHGFRLESGHPNAAAPGKRPYHTIIPAMITRPVDGQEQLFASYGVMGGFMQPQGHLQVAVNLIDDGLDPQAALDRPRFCLLGGNEAGRVGLEDGIPLDVMSGLADLGHRVLPRTGYARSLFGRGQVIQVDPESGALWAGSDPRADGLAMSL
jgi:gamma-glutamyltranspeptidase/glutathione hydrolase